MKVDTKNITQDMLQVAPKDGFLAHSCEQIAATEINIDVEKVPHQYSNGLFERVNSITITVKFPETTVLQGHVDLEEELGTAIVDTLVTNMYGECEASLDEMTEEEMNEVLLEIEEEQAEDPYQS